MSSLITEKNNDELKKLTKSLVDLLTKLKPGSGVEFLVNKKTKITLNCISDTNNNFTFDVTNDTSGKLKNLNKLTINIKKDSDNNSNIIQKNRDIIKNAKDGFTLIFKGLTKDNKKINVTFENITDVKSVNISNPSDNENDENDGYIEAGKLAYQKIINDPKLFDAFYKAPSFWQLFKSELTGEKPDGTGILTVLDIVKNYENSQRDLLEQSFIDKKEVTLKFLDDYLITFDKDKQLKFDSDENYKFIVYKGKREQKILLYGNLNGVKFYIPIYGIHGNRFYTKIKNNKYFFSIITDDNKSPGYKPIN